MKRPVIVFLLVTATALRAADGPEAALAEGRALMQQGDFETAVLKLDEAARGFSGDATRTRELADAHLFLGISYVELNQEQNAKSKFREVLKKEPQRVLSEREYSKQVIRVFEVARLELYPKKKNRFLPILLIAGGGTAAAAGVAVAASGGDTPTAAPTTATTLPPGGGGGGGTTTTTTTVVTDPGGPSTTAPTTTTTLPGSTTTTLPGSTTTTVPPTTTTTITLPGSTTTTTTTTTTTLPSCTYGMSPPSVVIPLLGGSGTCSVTTNLPTCPWTARATVPWLDLGGQTAGPGNGNISWTAGLTLTARSGDIVLDNTQGATAVRCVVSQGGLAPPPESVRPSGAIAQTRLESTRASGQVTLDGAFVHYQSSGEGYLVAPLAAGPHRVVAQIVAASGQPGAWGFDLQVPILPGTLRAVAGETLLVTDSSIVFRLSGRSGERVVFTFETQR